MKEGKKGKFPYKLARLSDSNNDITKQWVVVYYVWHFQEERLIRKRVRIDGATVKDRQKEADEVVKEINRLLKVGYIIDEEAPADPPEPEEVTTKESSLKEAIDNFMTLKTASLSPNTMKGYKGAMKRFKAYLKKKRWLSKPLTTFTARMAFEYFDDLNEDEDVANKTYNNHLGAIGGMFNFYVSREVIKTNPCKNVNQLPTTSGGHVPFTTEQAKQLKEAILADGDDQLWLFCSLMYYTFCRPGRELRFLQVKHIGQDRIFIPPDKSKSRKGKHVLIPPGLENLLQTQKIREFPQNQYVFSINGHPSPEHVGINYFYKRHRKYLRNLGLSADYTMYSWKHTGNISAYLAGADMMYLRDQNGHHSVSQTEDYLKDLGMIRKDSGRSLHPEL